MPVLRGGFWFEESFSSEKIPDILLLGFSKGTDENSKTIVNSRQAHVNNPYLRLISNPIDIAIVWLAVGGWLVVFARLFRRRFENVVNRSERLCAATALAFLALAGVFAVIHIIGLVFLAWLRIASIFWAFWEIPFLMSVVCLFWVMPFVALGIMLWAVVGKLRLGYSWRRVGLALVCLALVGLDLGLLYWFTYALNEHPAA